MNMPEEFTVPQAASYLNVSEETVQTKYQVETPACSCAGGLSGSFRAMSSWSLPTATTPRLVRYNKFYRCLVLIRMYPSPALSLRQVEAVLVKWLRLWTVPVPDNR